MGQKTLTNSEWIDHLKSDGVRQVESIEMLREMLLRAALFTMLRNLSDLRQHSQAEVLALAEDCAQDALIDILKQLDDFRGESRFTTWAYKFAVHKALETARRERWKGQSLDPLLQDADTDEWTFANSTGENSYRETSAVQAEIWQIIRQVIYRELTERQRQVFKLMVFDEVPMDVVAERMNTNRNAIYKILHDARLKMRRRIKDQGYSIHEILDVFDTSPPPTYPVKSSRRVQGERL